MLQKLIRLIVLLIIFSLFISLIESYNEGNLVNHFIFKNNPHLAREIERTIDIITLKDATNFIKNLPIR